MKVIIVGMGRVGVTLTEELCREGHNIVAIESDAAVLQECVDRFDIQGVRGKGCSADILREAGVETCDMLVSVMPEDENNILCCIVAKALGARNLIARVRDPEYYAQFEFLRTRIGIGMLVNPEEAASHEIMRILRFPAATKISSFSQRKGGGGGVQTPQRQQDRGHDPRGDTQKTENRRAHRHDRAGRKDHRSRRRRGIKGKRRGGRVREAL